VALPELKRTEYLKTKFEFGNPDFASVLDELSLWSARFGLLMLNQLEPVAGLEVLDLGCGTGFPLFELAQLYGNSCHFVGADVWQKGLDRAAFKRSIFGLKNVDLVLFDGLHFPFAEAQFDLIVSNLGLNNFEAPEAVLAECARITKPQGRLVLTTNLVGHYQEFYEVYRQVLVELGLSQALPGLDANEQHRGTKASVTTQVEQAGFHPVKLVEDQFQVRFLSGSALLWHWLTRIGFLGGWQEVVDIADRDRVFSTLEKRLNEVAQTQGYLTMTVPMFYLEAQR
jgi:arsenite methyltransferase